MSTIKRNYFYNSLLTLSNYVFPLIIYPYVSRVLGASNIGICNFVDSVVHWFILISMMGISILGNREMAAAGADKERRSKAFSGLLTLNLLTTLIAALALVGAIYTVPKLFIYRKLLWVGVLKLMSNFLCIEWYFIGTENFRYITGRTILVKTVFILAVLLFVRKADDYPVYYLLSVLVVLANALINISYARHTVSFSFRELEIRPYVKPYLMLGLYMVLTATYVTLNVTYLGFVSDSAQVGYYSTASKLYNIVISFFSAFTGVMLPRMSSLLSENKENEFRRMIGKSFDFLITFSIPLVLFATVCAPEIVRIFAGAGYEGAYIPARLIMPLIFIVGMEQIFVLQVLMPNRRDKSVFIGACGGAVAGITLTLTLVRPLQAVGSALVWVSSELVVLGFSAYFSRKEDGISFPWKQLGKQFLGYLPASVLSILVYLLLPSGLLRLGVEMALMGVYALVYVLFVQKNELVLNFLQSAFRRWQG